MAVADLFPPASASDIDAGITPSPDSKITRHYADLVIAARKLGERLTDIGIVDPEQLRYTIVAKEERKRLVPLLKAEGLSNRAIAKTLGVDHQTIANDLKAADGEKSPLRGEKSPPQPEKRDAPNAEAAEEPDARKYITLNEWNELHPDLQLSGGALESLAGTEGLNRQTNTDIEWADWSWNPVTGCLHTCPYCYARDIAFNVYPREVQFRPTFWPTRLNAPRDRQPTGEGALKNIFVCSMADLFGRWVPDRWIEAVLDTVDESPQWNFLFLTKFPKRMAEFDIPRNAWMGTTVDLQARVANAEKAFAKVEAPIRWLSIEPMLEPLQFKRLDLFDWIVIGGASPSKAVDGTPATPAWSVPIDWMVDLHRQARAAGCAIYYKDNSGLCGATRIREYPGRPRTENQAPSSFDYLGAMPKEEQTG